MPGGAAVGGTLGLAGVWLGYRAAARAAGEERRRALKRAAVAQAAAVVFASACFVSLPPLAGTLVGMTVLITVVVTTFLQVGGSGWGWVGLAAGLVGGSGGAIAGLHAGGVVDGATAAALLFELVCFFGAPTVLLACAPGWLATSARPIALGVGSWLVAAPFLFAAPAVAWALTQNPIASMVALSLTAGLVEETNRYVGFRLAGTTSARDAVLAGLGHGGVESLLIGAQVFAGALLGSAPAWTHVSMGAGRLAILLVHVGLSLLGFRAASERRPAPWVAAVALHAGPRAGPGRVGAPGGGGRRGRRGAPRARLSAGVGPGAPTRGKPAGEHRA